MTHETETDIKNLNEAPAHLKSFFGLDLMADANNNKSERKKLFLPIKTFYRFFWLPFSGYQNKYVRTPCLISAAAAAAVIMISRGKCLCLFEWWARNLHDTKFRRKSSLGRTPISAGAVGKVY